MEIKTYIPYVEIKNDINSMQIEHADVIEAYIDALAESITGKKVNKE